MNPKAIKEILSTPAGKEFVKYLAEKAISLDTLEGIDLNNPTEATIEMKARQRAIDKLKEILSGLLLGTESNKIKDSRDSFAVDVDLVDNKK